MCHRGSSDDVECRDVELEPNAACKTINHEIENAAKDGDGDGGNSEQGAGIGNRGAGPFKVAKLCKAGSCAGHFLVLRPFVPLLWPKRRKEVPERARAPQEKVKNPRGEATKRQGSQVTRFDGGRFLGKPNRTPANPWQRSQRCHSLFIAKSGCSSILNIFWAHDFQCKKVVKTLELKNNVVI